MNEYEVNVSRMLVTVRAKDSTEDTFRLLEKHSEREASCQGVQLGASEDGKLLCWNQTGRHETAHNFGSFHLVWVTYFEWVGLLEIHDPSFTCTGSPSGCLCGSPARLACVARREVAELPHSRGIVGLSVRGRYLGDKGMFAAD